MGDRSTYRDIVTKLIIEGLPAHQITYKDAKGKLHRLATPGASGGTPSFTTASIDQARDLAAQLRAAREAAKEAAQTVDPSPEPPPEVASDSDG